MTVVVEEAVLSLIKSKRKQAIVLNGRRQVIAQLEINVLLQRAILQRTNHGTLSKDSQMHNLPLRKLKARVKAEKAIAIRHLLLKGPPARVSNLGADRKVEGEKAGLGIPHLRLRLRNKYHLHLLL